MAVLRLVFFVILLSGIGACFHARVNFQKGGMELSSKQVVERWYHGGVFGLVDFEKELLLGEICPQGVSYVEQGQHVWSVLAQLGTLFLYTPQHLRIHCSENVPPPEAAGGRGSNGPPDVVQEGGSGDPMLEERL